MTHRLTRRGLIAASTLLAAPALAQGFPQRDVSFVVPFAPGGGTDPIGRAFARSLERVLRSNVTVENRPGGSATIGISSVVRSRPDGYTLGLGTNAALAQQPLINNALPWRSPDDYDALAKMVDLPSIIVVRADSPWRNLGDFIEHARANPGRVRASVSGLGTIVEMTVQQLNKGAGVRVRPVPFTGGGGEGLVALLGGRVEANVTSGAAGITGHVQSGAVRVIGVVGSERYEPFPEATPFAAAGINASMPYACYVVAPKGLPGDVRERLVGASLEAIRSTEFAEFARVGGMVVDARGPDETRAELVRYSAEFVELMRFVAAN